jgi:hypothetical protein
MEYGIGHYVNSWEQLPNGRRRVLSQSSGNNAVLVLPDRCDKDSMVFRKVDYSSKVKF